MTGGWRNKKTGEAEAWFIGCEGYTEEMVLMNEVGNFFNIDKNDAISGKWVKDVNVLEGEA